MFIYPAIDLRGGRCVRLRQGDYGQETVFHEDPVAVACQWQQAGADRLHIVDLDGARQGRPIHEVQVRRLVDLGLPIQLGGGIRSEQDIERVLGWGVRWVVLGTRALQQPQWLEQMARHWPQRIVLGVDARAGYVAVAGWQEQTQRAVSEVLASAAAAPLAAIVYTDIARDGMLTGPNLEALRGVQAASAWPVIASGGVGCLEDVRQLRDAGLWGCIIGRALYEGRVRLADALALARASDS